MTDKQALPLEYAMPPHLGARAPGKTHYRWWICALLFFATTTNYVDRQLFANLVPFFEDDLRMGSKSTAILFGEMDLIAQGVLYTLFFVALALVGQRAAMGAYYWIGLAVALVLVAYEFRIARHRERAACFRAFLHNHWVGLAIFAGIAADFALRAPAA